MKDAKGSQAKSSHDSDDRKKDGEGGHQGAGAVPRSPGIHRVAVVGGAPGEEWGYMRKKEKENKPTLSGLPCR